MGIKELNLFNWGITYFFSENMVKRNPEDKVPLFAYIVTTQNHGDMITSIWSMEYS